MTCCEAPLASQKRVYHVMVTAIMVETLCMALSLVGCALAVGFQVLLFAGGLSFFSSVVGLTTMSAYTCCCVNAERPGRRRFVTSLTFAVVLATIAIVYASISDDSPCVRHTCHAQRCQKCDDKGRSGCDPKHSYYCTHDEYLPICGNVKWCSTWDSDCSKSGYSDDGSWWGYETRRSCEDSLNVKKARNVALYTILTGLIVTLCARIACAAIVFVVPPPGASVPVTRVSLGRGAESPAPVAHCHPAVLVQVLEFRPTTSTSPSSGARRPRGATGDNVQITVDDVADIPSPYLPRAAPQPEIQYAVKL